MSYLRTQQRAKGRTWI